jgi:hypothetical protein
MITDINGYSIALHKLYYGFVVLFFWNDNELIEREFNGHHPNFKEDIKELLKTYPNTLIQKPKLF